MSLLNIRPAPGAQANPFAVYLSPQTLITYGLKTGDVVLIEMPDRSRREVQVVRSVDKNMSATVVQMSGRAQKLYSLGTQQKVRLIPKSIEVAHCQNIVVHEIHDEASDEQASENVLDSEWSNALQREVQILEMVSAGLELIDVTGPEGRKRSFKVAQVDNNAGLKVFRIPAECNIRLLSADALKKPLHLDDSVSDVCGLDETICQLQNRLSWFGGSNDGTRRWQGILLYGPAGTGKSMLVDSVLKADWLAKIEVDSSFTKTMLDETVDAALKCQPALIAVHDLADIAPRTPAGTLSRSLRRAFARIAGAQVLIIAACRALADIDQELRNVECFGFQFEVPTPNTVTRAKILNVNYSVPRGDPGPLLEHVSKITHGFVGRDLVHLLQQAKAMAERRIQAEEGQHTRSNPCDATFDIKLTEGDFLKALKLVRPSALREIVVETPDVRWQDVAGQDHAKQLLEKAITWPLKVRFQVSRFSSLSDMTSMRIYSRNTTSKPQRACSCTDHLDAPRP